MRDIAVALILFFSTPLMADWFSVTAAEMASFERQCSRHESSTAAASGVNGLLEHRRQQPFTLHPSTQYRTDYIAMVERYQNLPASITRVNIDGFEMDRPSIHDLDLILRLTEANDAQLRYLNKNRQYGIEFSERDGTFYIRRTCDNSRSAMPGVSLLRCPNSNVARPLYDLSSFNRSSGPCDNAVCATERIFGANATNILASETRFDLVTTPYREPDRSDPAGMTVTNSRALLAATHALPGHLHERCLHNNQFLTMGSGQGEERVVANAAGHLFRPMHEYSSAQQIQIFFHEFAHRAARRPNLERLDETEEWLRIAGFERFREDSPNVEYRFASGRSSVSEYGDSSPEEDFAESMNMYRFAPQRLQQVSPERYNYLRDNVFNGWEYIQELCNGSQLPIRPGGLQTDFEGDSVVF